MRFRYKTSSGNALGKELRRASWGAVAFASAAYFKVEDAGYIAISVIAWLFLQIGAIFVESMEAENE